MNKFTTAAVAALGLALVASTPAFAGGRTGGSDTQNPVEHVGAPANGPEIQVWGGEEVDTRPTVSVDAVTGGSSGSVTTYNAGRITYRAVTSPDAASNGSSVATNHTVVFQNGG
jgi:hypothetical protein